MELKLSRQIFEKSSSIKFHANPSSGSRFLSCGLTDRRTDRQEDMTEVTVAFRNFANVPTTCTASDNVIRQRAKYLQVLYTTAAATTTTTTLNILMCSYFVIIIFLSLYVTFMSLKKLQYCDLPSPST